MDYLTSHPWVALVGVAAIGFGVWWWMSHREKFLLGRVKALLGRKKKEEEHHISGPFNARPLLSPELKRHRFSVQNDFTKSQMEIPYVKAFVPPEGWNRRGHTDWGTRGPEVLFWV